MASSVRHEHKRHGKHQKHTGPFLKVYRPYLPLLLIVTIGIILSVISPPRNSKGVLAYATSMSINELLTSTNQDRAAAGLAPLTLNTQLDSAAQTKANDMVSRDYWAHVTPDGQQPWVFYTNAGYSYLAAGENLAYGFSSSAATEQGWMNSPEHKANILNGNYVEVGFGFKDATNFVGTGQETVVVAEYAKPVTAAVASSSTTKTPPASAPAAPATTNSPPAAQPPATNKIVVPSQPAASTDQPKPSVNTVAAVEPTTQTVSRLSRVTGLNIPWLSFVSTTIIGLSVAALAARHMYAINRWIRRGERYVLHHFAFDVTIISLIGLSYIASQSVGFIK